MLSGIFLEKPDGGNTFPWAAFSLAILFALLEELLVELADDPLELFGE